MIDLELFLRMYGGPFGVLGTACNVLAVLGSGWAALLLAPLAVSLHTRRMAAFLAAAIGTQAALVWALKAAVGRVRPWIRFGLAPPIGTPHDGSFPSGHAAGSFCVAAFLCVLLPSVSRSPVRARLLSAAAVAVAALVALSRVYLGAHFPLDVLGGACLGATIGATSAGVYARRPSRRADARRPGTRADARPLWNAQPKEAKRRAP